MAIGLPGPSVINRQPRNKRQKNCGNESVAALNLPEPLLNRLSRSNCISRCKIYAHIDVDAKQQRSGTPDSTDAHSLSQVFRAVGAIVEQKQGRFLAVIKEGQEIVIEYESISKRNTVEKFTVSSLYDYWVKMYLRRSERR